MSNSLENIDNIPWQVQQLEELTHRKKSVYFDVEDFEEIIDYYVVQANYKQSLNIAEYACRLHPSSINLMLKRAQLLASDNKEKHALELLSEVEVLEPSNFEIFLTRGAIYSQMHNYEKAIEEYNKAVIESDEPDYVYCNIAFEYENMGNYSKTIEYLKKALEVNPENDLAMYEAAYCFDLLSLSQESIDFFSKLIDKHPYSTEAWFNLGISFINTELYEKALEAFEFALAIDPEHNSAIFHCAYTYSLMNRHTDAINAYHTLLDKEDDESDAIIHYYIGECYEKLEDYDSAKAFYRKSTRLNAEITDAWIGLGVCENELGNTKAAIKHIIKGLELDSENTAYLCILADIYFQEGLIDKASDLYEKAISTSPEEESVRIDFADGLAEREAYEAAAEVIMKAIEEIAPGPNLYYRMAALLYLQEKNKEGAFFMEEALTMDFDRHTDMLEQYPQLKDHQNINKLINLYSS
ncbi:MAG: tetratricopeptide repeat protein [Bacteroidetes bacterium]|nr:MAG: tetratricopeptide repeat protein [Bacteroidota bacterium]